MGVIAERRRSKRAERAYVLLEGALGCGRSHGLPEGVRGERGQMTIELAVAMPVLIAVSVIAVNAMIFFADCAVFDRVVCDSVRLYATSPAHGEDLGREASLIEQAVSSQMGASNLNVEVEHRKTGADFDEYTATLRFSPTLFGMGLRSEAFGVALPQLEHEARYVVDSYKPGVVV